MFTTTEEESKRPEIAFFNRKKPRGKGIKKIL